MTKTSALFPLVAAFFLALAGVPVQAGDRLPTDAERASIESALKAEGFSSWGKIELDDDGYWEVDNAIGSDGKRYDVDLATSDFKIIKKKIDSD